MHPFCNVSPICSGSLISWSGLLIMPRRSAKRLSISWKGSDVRFTGACESFSDPGSHKVAQQWLEGQKRGSLLILPRSLFILHYKTSHTSSNKIYLPQAVLTDAALCKPNS